MEMEVEEHIPAPCKEIHHDSPRFCNMEINVDVLDQWRGVGAREGLETDTDIARFFLSQYRLPQSTVHPSTECQHCRAPLTLVCAACGLPACTQKDDLRLKSELGVKNRRIKVEGCDMPVKMPSNVVDHEKQDDSDTELADIPDKMSNEALRDNSHEATIRIKRERSLSDRDASPESHAGGSFTETVVEDVHGDGSTSEQQIHVYNRLVPAATSTVYSTGGFRRRGAQADSGGSTKQRKKGKRQSEPAPVPSPQRRGAAKGIAKTTATPSPSHTGEESFRSDVRTLHSADRSFKCSDCGKYFVSAATLKTHTCSHRESKTVPESTTQLLCQLCGAAFKRKASLKDHLLTHANARNFKCDECEKAYNTRGGLRQHKHLVHPARDKSSDSESPMLFLCQLCGMSFKRKDSLKEHTQRHANTRNFKCGMCEKAFNTPGCLRQHIRYVHIGREKRYKCSECGHLCVSPFHLKIHARSHTGEKPFVCPTCSKTFSSQNHLHDHRKVHETKRPYVCEVCEADFRDPRNLKLHTRKHTGEKPYKCKHCGETFSWGSGLRWHMRKLHPD